LLPARSTSRKRATLNHLRKALRSLGELNDAKKAKSLATALKHAKQMNLAVKGSSLGKKRKKRLIRSATTSYRKMAHSNPFLA